MRELYGDEVLELMQLADLLQDPEKYGCIIDRGTNPEAARIIETGIADILSLPNRPYPVGPGEWLAKKSTEQKNTD